MKQIIRDLKSYFEGEKSFGSPVDNANKVLQRLGNRIRKICQASNDEEKGNFSSNNKSLKFSKVDELAFAA